jgi:DNA-binding transcriptional LysR family regulator
MQLGYAQVAALLAVIREGSFEGAARALHVTASAISQRIKQLEANAGGIVVVRGTPCRPTSLGEAPRAELTIVVDFIDNQRATTTLTLVGPGDIVGLDPRVVTRTYPRRDDNDAEFQHFAMVELDQADMPWRYTPARPKGDVAGNTDTLRPWLSLIVLAEKEPEFTESQLKAASRATWTAWPPPGRPSTVAPTYRPTCPSTTTGASRRAPPAASRRWPRRWPRGCCPRPWAGGTWT